MTLSSKVILNFLAGTVSAMIAWVIVDFNGFHRLGQSANDGSFWQLYSQQAFVGVVFGILVGLGIGFVNGLSGGTKGAIQRGVLYGGLVGLIGGLLGLFFGQLFFGVLYVEIQPGALSPFLFLWDVIVRAFGWALIGLFLGVAQGFPINSQKAMRHGAIGGFIGGLLGGMLFELMPNLLPPGTYDRAVASRGISMTITGAFIGLFIGLVENLLKQAWIRVVQGRNEGREYIISKDKTTIGRDERADIGLFSDYMISPLHAIIEATPGGRHILEDAGTSVGTVVNGNKITEHTLRDGEVIQIGSMRLEFHEKATASRVPRMVDMAPKPPVQIPVSPGQCPFCGGRKDPLTGECACSVGAPVSPSPQSAPSSTWTQPDTGYAPQVTGGIPRLVGLAGPYSGQSFPLATLGDTTVGREDSRHIQLVLDSTVSRRHAHISGQGGAFVVYDEGSSNGTSVNGARISMQPLAPGDVISFGNSSFRFEM